MIIILMGSQSALLLLSARRIQQTDRQNTGSGTSRGPRTERCLSREGNTKKQSTLKTCDGTTEEERWKHFFAMEGGHRKKK